jgi:hypothetical protein
VACLIRIYQVPGLTIREPAAMIGLFFITFFDNTSKPVRVFSRILSGSLYLNIGTGVARSVSV